MLGRTSRRCSRVRVGAVPARTWRWSDSASVSRSAPAIPGEDFARRPRRPALLEPDVVLRGDVGEDRGLLAAQPRCPASRSGGEADVLWPEPLATATEERPELLLVHTPSLHAARRRILVPPVPASGLETGLTLSS
jgi:hypothetical protein